ncbi:hypothetical protein [Brunnivagina elsteri]|nr:hypothetical protein [Calothrix elsteri]
MINYNASDTPMESLCDMPEALSSAYRTVLKNSIKYFWALGIGHWVISH